LPRRLARTALMAADLAALPTRTELASGAPKAGN